VLDVAAVVKQMESVSMASNIVSAIFWFKQHRTKGLLFNYLSHSVNYCTKGKILYQKTFL
jgi:hypothetical protein